MIFTRFFPPLFSPPPVSQRGMSMVELLVTMSILALAIATAVPRMNKSLMNMPTAVQTLLGEIRMARANATSRGAHYRVSLSSSSYTIQRLQDTDGDGVWEPDGSFPTRTVELPRDISVSEGAGEVIEFDTRGLLVSAIDGTPASVITVEIHDAHDGESKTIEVWPSGQVEEA